MSTARLDNREPAEGHRQDREETPGLAPDSRGGNPEPSRRAMPEPQTKAGRALLADLVPAPRGHEATCHECLALLHEEREAEGTRIVAIEAEARDAALAEYKARLDRAEGVVAAARTYLVAYDRWIVSMGPDFGENGAEAEAADDALAILRAAIDAYEDADKVADG